MTVTHSVAGFTLNGNGLVCDRQRADSAAAWEETGEGDLPGVREERDEKGAVSWGGDCLRLLMQVSWRWFTTAKKSYDVGSPSPNTLTPVVLMI